MRDSRLFRLGGILLAVPLLASYLARAQGGAHFSAPSRATSPRHNSTTLRSAPMQAHKRNAFSGSQSFSNGALSNTFDNVNVVATSSLGINGINLIAAEDIGTEAAINPSTQWQLAIAERIAHSTFRILPSGGFVLLDGDVSYVMPVESGEYEQPVQQQQQFPALGVSHVAAQQAQLCCTGEPALSMPLLDSAHFTLVLRDTLQVETIAFTRMTDRIIYIVRDGSRRSMPANELDVDATVRLNQERGISLQFLGITDQDQIAF